MNTSGVDVVLPSNRILGPPLLSGKVFRIGLGGACSIANIGRTERVSSEEVERFFQNILNPALGAIESPVKGGVGNEG